MLLLYPAILLNSFISSSSFYMESLGFSKYSIMLSAYDSSTSSLPFWIPFISFSCVIPVARTSSTVLNRSRESGHPCLLPDFSGKVFSFSPKYYVGCVFVVNSFNCVEVFPLYLLS